MQYDKNAKLVRAPHYIDVGTGKDQIRLGIRPLTDECIVSLDNYCRTKHILAACEAAKSLDSATAALVRQDAIMQASGITIISDIGINIISNLDGISHLLWQMSGGEDCKYSEAEVRKAVFSDPNSEITADIKDMFLSQNIDFDESENDPEKKHQNRKTRAKKAKILKRKSKTS